MQIKELHQFKKRLEAEQTRLTAQISRLQEDAGRSMADSLSELSLYDNHPADVGDELFERSNDRALLANEQLLLAEVEKALTRIADQTYGQCGQCGRIIPIERLQAMPWASQCLDCQQNMDKAAAEYTGVETV